MAARLDTPVLGVQTTSTEQSRWQLSTSWRYQHSHRHFVGTEEQVEREEQGSEVINTIHLMDVGVRYKASDQWSFSFGVPYLMAERSSPIRDANRVVVDRSLTQARGLGDITVSARRLLWEPRGHPNGNISIGLGLKLPTGNDNIIDTRQQLDDKGQIVNRIQSVDQSIQPGDGGFGLLLDFQSFLRIGRSGAAFYLSGNYLFNPEEKNGVPTYRSRSGEEVMSIADQYVARAGATYFPASWKGFGVSLGGRIEGVPSEDLIGGSNGFRRPGYAISIEPGLGYGLGNQTFLLAVPIALQRNRLRSVPDNLEGGGRHGDAAFADYLVLFSYSHQL